MQVTARRLSFSSSTALLVAASSEIIAKRIQMPTEPFISQFVATLHRPENFGNDGTWTFCLVPKEVSQTLPRRGRATVRGLINGHSFQSTLEPDGQLSHWLKVSQTLQKAVGASVGDALMIEFSPLEVEPDPEVPADLKGAIESSTKACRVWASTSSVARLDWIHWVDSAKQAKTREKRIRNAVVMLADGKKRVCCFDPSGFYSKALEAPQIAR